jgi:hypothetical protein
LESGAETRGDLPVARADHGGGLQERSLFFTVQAVGGRPRQILLEVFEGLRDQLPHPGHDHLPAIVEQTRAQGGIGRFVHWRRFRRGRISDRGKGGVGGHDVPGVASAGRTPAYPLGIGTPNAVLMVRMPKLPALSPAPDRRSARRRERHHRIRRCGTAVAQPQAPGLRCAALSARRSRRRRSSAVMLTMRRTVAEAVSTWHRLGGAEQHGADRDVVAGRRLQQVVGDVGRRRCWATPAGWPRPSACCAASARRR